ncbi:MAG: hypothetical protein QF442_00615 [Candidatus Peribacteraceae bacterium]|jgi:hypothetical protein|nr:hypothetical protein [Candidatus Peribacteraceae bacterium]
MRIRFLFALAFLLLSTTVSVRSAEAASFYENIRFTQRSRSQVRQSASQYQYQPRSQYNSSSNSVCLYRNPQGECMIEQYFEPNNNYYNDNYTPVYSRNYLYNERRYSNRDYYDKYDCHHYDDDYYDDDYDDWEDIKDDFFDDD